MANTSDTKDKKEEKIVSVVVNEVEYPRRKCYLLSP
jgi:hypothetical protein